MGEGGIDVGDPMLKIEKCCEGDRAPPTPQKSENKFRVIWLSMRKDSHCRKWVFDERVRMVHQGCDLGSDLGTIKYFGNHVTSK